MAITKIKPIKATVRKALDYILNPNKTDSGLLVSSFGCSAETADIEFEFTRQAAAMKKGNNLAHHLIQSFEPGETTPEQAHEIGRRLADETLGGKYEYVISTHIEKGHIHNHIIFNAASFENKRKYISNKKSMYDIRNKNDMICREFGLSVIKPNNGRSKGKTYKEYAEHKQGTSWKAQFKNTIDEAIKQAATFDEFLKLMRELGHEHDRRGKFLRFKIPGQDRFIRLKAETLGTDYTEENIKSRIREHVSSQADMTVNNPLIDLQNLLKVGDNKGLERWAKINNLKQAAKTLNYLTENNILGYEHLQTKVVEARTALRESTSAIKTLDSRLKDITTLIKNINSYKQTKPIHEQYQKAIFKEGFYKQHKRELLIFDMARNALKEVAPCGKLPNVKALQLEYDTLSQQREILHCEFSKLRNELNEYKTAQDNIDMVLCGAESKKQRARDIEM